MKVRSFRVGMGFAMAALAFAPAFAVDYTWSGGASGEWTSSANWTPSGYPNGADDTAAFALSANQAVTISSAVTVKGISVSGTKPLNLSGSAITLGADGINSTSTSTGAVITVENAVSIAAAKTVVSNTTGAVHFMGTVSGTGGILKGGAARLHLHAANTFAGGLESSGTGLSPCGAYVGASGSLSNGKYKFAADAKDSSGVVIYDVEALGTGKATFDPGITGDNGTGPRLTVMNCSGTITNDIRLPNNRCSKDAPNASNVYQLEIYGGDITFSGKVECAFRLYVRLLSANTVHFSQEIGHGNYLVFRAEVPNAEIYCDAELRNSCEFAGNSSSRICLNAPSSNGVNLFLSGSRLTMMGENYLPSKLDYEFYWQSNDAVVDLNGFDQTVLSWVEKPKAKLYPGAQIYSPENAPAKIAFKVGTGNVLDCRFTGAAGFTWEPTADRTLSISNTLSTTRGVVGVTNGTVRVMSGAAFTSLTELGVAAGATFRIEADAGIEHKADRLVVESGAAVDVAAGKVLTVGSMTVDGVPVAEGTTITRLNPPEGLEFLGDGSIYVTGAGSPVYWQGAANANWNDGANWSSGSVPDSACDVFVTNAASILLDAAMPRVHALYLGDGSKAATLTATNLNSTITANSIVVANQATITCGAAFTNETDMSRVHIVCNRLEVEEGGVIDASAKGWSGGLWELAHDSVAKHAVHQAGYGPGVVPDASAWGSYGATHGGRGASREILGNTIPGPYGDARHPVTAGSGGTLAIGYGGTDEGNFKHASHGGGVIRIEATGAVIVNGAIKANAEDIGTGSNRDTAGAGGSVWITCASVQGTGTISANGGSGGEPRVPALVYRGMSSNATDTDVKYGMMGGGGRIAIDYDPAAQALVDPAGLLVSAAGGDPHKDCGNLATRDNWEVASENGTLAFTDLALVKKLFGNGLSGRVVGLKTLAFEGDLEFTRGFVSTMEEGFELSVGGDFTITGDKARLEVGGVCLTNRASRATVWAGEELNRLTVGGDFAVSNGASFVIRAAATNSTMRWGAEVQVAGAMTVGSNGYVYAASDGVNLAAPRFVVAGDMTVDRYGTVSADRRGGLGADLLAYVTTYFGKSRSTGYGFGGGNCSASGSHGGLGKLGLKGETSITPSSASLVAPVYDDPWLPMLPGSGGGSSGYGEGGTGGGVVFIAAGGDMQIDGRVSADGGSTAYYANTAMCEMGAGSGGTVLLCGRTVSGGANAVVSAKGGGGMQGRTPGYQPTGGGGCIAIWEGAGYLISGEFSKRRHNEKPAAFLGECDASGGDFLFTRYFPLAEVPAEMQPLLKGDAGTVRYGTFGPMHGVRLIFR